MSCTPMHVAAPPSMSDHIPPCMSRCHPPCMIHVLPAVHGCRLSNPSPSYDSQLAAGLSDWLVQHAPGSGKDAVCVKTLSHAASWMAASGASQKLATMALISSHLLQLQQKPSAAPAPTSPSPSASPPTATRGFQPGKSSPLRPASPSSEVVTSEALAAAPLDHRSLCRFAWAFSVAGVTQDAPWEELSRSAVSAIEALLQVWGSIGTDCSGGGHLSLQNQLHHHQTA